MALIAIGDVHGNLAALRDLLGRLQGEVGAADTLVFLGDYIDRGPDSRGCVDAILALRANPAPRVVCLRGNHEDWMLRTKADHRRHSWLTGMDAADTIRSYSPEADAAIAAAMREEGLQLYLTRTRLPYGPFFESMPAAHHDFFDGLALSFEADDCFCAHAGVDPDVADFAGQTQDSLLWGARGFPRAYFGDKTIVYGHWNNAIVDDRGWPAPRFEGRTIGIDTISRGVLTAVRMPDRRVFQSARYPHKRE
jgi:serine/threonine protein phosphatase 1